MGGSVTFENHMVALFNLVLPNLSIAEGEYFERTINEHVLHSFQC